MLKRECWLHVGEAKIYINIRRTLLRERDERRGTDHQYQTLYTHSGQL